MSRPAASTSRVAALGFVCGICTACGAEEDPADAASSSSSSTNDAGSRPGCRAGEMPLEGGGCRPAGVLPEECGAGFVTDGVGGCQPILPVEPCSAGQMAIPGDAACREVAACGDGTWGDIPTDATTQHVDASFAGATSDGSERAPWKTIAAAIDAADDGAIVAVAAGSYAESLQLQTKRVRIWGRCPRMVEVTGASDGAASVTIVTSGASASELHTIAVTNAGAAVVISGAEQIVLDRVWVHDTGSHAVAAFADHGPTSVGISGSLLEKSTRSGVALWSSDVVLETTHIRDVAADSSDPTSARGVSLDWDMGDVMPSLTVRSSHIERVPVMGISYSGAYGEVVDTVIRDIAFSDDAAGFGLNVEQAPLGRSNVTMRGSLVERARTTAVRALSSDLLVETSVVRDTQAKADGTHGRGLDAIPWEDSREPSSATVRASVIERNRELGVAAFGSQLTLESTIVRDNTGSPSDGAIGVGVVAKAYGAMRPTVVVRGCRIEHNQEGGIVASDADVDIEGTLVADTRASAVDGSYGFGVYFDGDSEQGSRASIARSEIVGNRLGGLTVIDSEASVQTSLIAETRPEESDGSYGDGVALLATDGRRASLALREVRLVRNARGGLTSFAGRASIAASTFECNPIQLHGEPFAGETYELVDEGDNVCGCEGTTTKCTVQSTTLAPPPAAETPEPAW